MEPNFFERVYLVWAESGTDSGAVAKKNPFMIRMRTSDDLGATLSAPITIHADAIPTSRWFPRGTQVAVTPGGGVSVRRIPSGPMAYRAPSAGRPRGGESLSAF